MATNNRKSSKNIRDSLRVEYSQKREIADRLRECLKEQIEILLEKSNITLGVPMESRVKSLDSIEEKIDRKDLSVRKIDEIPDLVGIRIILLFRKDLKEIDKIIRKNFLVISSEDASSRLNESQFGYQSQHYMIKILEKWTEVPSYSDLGEMHAELQVRTVAQHIWAAASHKLQYKREESVPPPLRRSIHRASALLETVDLEFSRILEERDDYISNNLGISDNSLLNVDLVGSILQKYFPQENWKDNEPYDALLMNFNDLGVDTTGKLIEILDKHTEAALKCDSEKVATYRNEDPLPEWVDPDRLAKGVYFSYVGLARKALEEEFGNSKVSKTVLRSMNKFR